MSQTTRRTAYYAGSFDPVTNGHVDVLVRACGLADRLVVGIGIHPGKVPLFSADERAEMITASISEAAKTAGTEISIVTFADLVVHAARRLGRKGAVISSNHGWSWIASANFLMRK